MAKRLTRPPKQARDELEILHPDRVLTIAGAAWTLREYSLVETAQVFGAGSAVTQAMDAGQAPPWPALIACLALATGKGEIEVAGVSVEDMDRLTAAWRALNFPLFLPDDTPKGGKPTAWGDLYATLIAHGHDLDRIGRYTGRQLELLYRAAIKRERRARANRISDTNLAFAGGEAAKRQLRQLQGSV